MAVVEGTLNMFDEVRGWMETPVESDDLLGLGKIPYSVVQLGLCLGIEYKDIYEIDHNYRFAHNFLCSCKRITIEYDECKERRKLIDSEL